MKAEEGPDPESRRDIVVRDVEGQRDGGGDGRPGLTAKLAGRGRPQSDSRGRRGGPQGRRGCSGFRAEHVCLERDPRGVRQMRPGGRWGGRLLVLPRGQ